MLTNVSQDVGETSAWWDGTITSFLGELLVSFGESGNDWLQTLVSLGWELRSESTNTVELEKEKGGREEERKGESVKKLDQRWMYAS